MNTAPEWLEEFPFIHSQWPYVDQLLKTCSKIDQYEVKIDWEQFLNQHQHLDSFSLLRKFRKSRLAFLAYLDFQLPINDHIKTMHLVSKLADHLINQAYSIAVEEMKNRFGEVFDSDGNLVCLQVFALGKLGTNELNYSSDVDLVFVFTKYGESNGDRVLDADSYFTRLGQKIIKLLDYFGTDGLVYRVDMRLRPFGAAGPLVCSETSLAQYLINEGRDWERFAWMRARLICGDFESAQSLFKEVGAFIYRKHLDYNVFTSLARIKKSIASVYQNSSNDLKHGLGGIRAIEFIVQSLQLVFGGRVLKLQNVAIYPMFDALQSENKLSVEDAELLKLTWLWLRKLENMSQIINDQPTHELPVGESIETVFAEINGHSSWQSLNKQLLEKRQWVDDLFLQLFKDSDQEEPLSQTGELLLQRLLDQINFQRVPQDTVQKSKKLLELTVLKAPEAVCHDFVQIIKVLLKRPSYLLMLIREQNVHINVLKLLGNHAYFKTTLIAYPVLFEQLFDHQSHQTLTHQLLSEAWSKQQSDSFNEHEIESWMEQLRYFKLVNQFNLMRSFSVAEMTQKQLSIQLTLLAEFIIFEVCQLAWKETHEKYPKVGLMAEDLMVIAYGSMAVYDMSITSDLDLVFVIDHLSFTAEARVFMQKWVRRIIHHLGSQMYHGLLYEIDLQLRPNGQSGPLVTSKSEFEKYQKTQAWTWEHAAMVKSRMVLGSTAQKKWHQNLRHDILKQVRDPQKVNNDLVEMAGKLQQLKGTKFHQKDFLMLGQVLIHAHNFPELLLIDDMMLLEDRLKQLNLLD